MVGNRSTVRLATKGYHLLVGNLPDVSEVIRGGDNSSQSTSQAVESAYIAELVPETLNFLCSLSLIWRCVVFLETNWVSNENGKLFLLLD